MRGQSDRNNGLVPASLQGAADHPLVAAELSFHKSVAVTIRRIEQCTPRSSEP
ncbi:hypothetical protein [Paenibacillus harenae]|uniref:hypothetical protein n=1 Tax=Paenibacillus harenae TaxID=306543 RepID=UPI0004277AA6